MSDNRRAEIINLVKENNAEIKDIFIGKIVQFLGGKLYTVAFTDREDKKLRGLSH